MHIDPMLLDVLKWVRLGLMIYMVVSFYSFLLYNLYRDRTKHPREWPRPNRYFEYYNAYPAATLIWILYNCFDQIGRLVKRIKPHTNVLMS